MTSGKPDQRRLNKSGPLPIVHGGKPISSLALVGLLGKVEGTPPHLEMAQGSSGRAFVSSEVEEEKITTKTQKMQKNLGISMRSSIAMTSSHYSHFPLALPLLPTGDTNTQW